MLQICKQKRIVYILSKVQDIEKVRILAEENAQEAQQKETEANQLEQELREANKRVRFSGIRSLLILLP